MDIGNFGAGIGIASSTAPIRRLGGLLRPVLTDFPFRDLAPDSTTQQSVEVIAVNGGLPPRGTPIRELQHPETGEHLLTVDEGVNGIQWHFDGLGDFWVDPTGWVARYALQDGASLGDAESVLLGPVLGLAAQQRGELVLHASTVVLDGNAIAFSAPPGFGKSTLATSFIDDDVALLSDDMLPVTFNDGIALAHPYLPRTKLHDDSLERIRGAANSDEERALSWWGKRRIQVGAGWGCVHPGAARLRTLYLLNPSSDPHTPIAFDVLNPVEATLRLQAALYSPPTLLGARASRAFLDSQAFTAAVRVVRLSYFRDYNTLQMLRSRLREDVAATA